MLLNLIYFQFFVTLDLKKHPEKLNHHQQIGVKYVIEKLIVPSFENRQSCNNFGPCVYVYYFTYLFIQLKARNKIKLHPLITNAFSNK